VILAAVVSLTLAIHYGQLGHAHHGQSPLLIAIHARLCYIPIVIAAIWFGLRGGLLCALIISTAIIPYIIRTARPEGQLTAELTEIVFYFAIGTLSGALVERERLQRKKSQEAHVRLEQTQRLSMMGQMAAGVAHEIKNPLASIKGAVDILAEGVAPQSPKEEFAEIIRKEVRRLNATVQSFLDFAKPRPFQFSLEKLDEILASTLTQMEPQIASTSLILQSTIPRFDERVWADPQKLRQVFINLILNAIAATPPGGRITVELGKTTRNGERLWQIDFSDTGAGIAAENLEKIFEPFFTQKTTGSGLGLAIVKSIIEEHKGRIEVHSAPGKGTRFTVLLPTRTSSET